MTLITVLYVAGVVRLWRRAGIGRGVEGWRVACFAGGVAALSVSLIWPLDALAGAALSAHMAQHVMLTACAAPLLAASAPIVTSLWGLPVAWRRRLGGLGRRPALRSGKGVLTLPIFAWCFYTAMLWGWHTPDLYQAALLNDGLHTLEHVAFLAGALLLWWTVLLSVRGALGVGSGIFLLFTTGLQEGLLGALLTFSQRALYPLYEAAPGIWDITAVEDQQLAGILMWIPGGLVYLTGGLLLCLSWLQQLGRAHPLRPLRGDHQIPLLPLQRRDIAPNTRPQMHE
jgi:putative membrane protein